jgi:hypothetical protein
LRTGHNSHALAGLIAGDIVQGYYDKTWAPRAAPAGTNLGVAFSGWARATRALSDAAVTFPSLVGSKYLSIGGGNGNGRWTLASITELNSQLSTIGTTGYVGVCYDIEEGDSGLASALTDSFAQAKAAGLKVLVTVSHSAPYGISDAGVVMAAIASSADVDYLSPQLYTSGDETANDYTGTWTLFKTANAAIVATITTPRLYSSAQTYFSQQQGITLSGFIAWPGAAWSGSVGSFTQIQVT